MKFYDCKKIMNPTFINYGDQFLSKYINYEELIKRSDIEDEKFDNGQYKFNELLDIFTTLNICTNVGDTYKLNKLSQSMTFKQIIILKAIEKYKPSWCQRFRFGLDYIKELKETEPNLFQCLSECGIFSNQISQESLHFIYEIKKLIYSEDVYKKSYIEIGALGEKLSKDYEFQKTGLEPFQQSLWNDKAGYDLKSYTKDGDIKRIEVKASQYNRAFITWNEWKTANQSLSDGITYEFHFWKIKDDMYFLAKIKPSDLDFLPKIHPDGHAFDNYEIKYAGFEDRFKEITL